MPPDRAASGAAGDGAQDPLRERSPRRQPSSSCKAFPSGATAAGTHVFFLDRAGVLNGIVARPEPNGPLAEVFAYVTACERHHVRVRSSAAQVWVRGGNLKPPSSRLFFLGRLRVESRSMQFGGLHALPFYPR